MATVCLSSKYGYCKFGNYCDKTHYKEKCETEQCSGYECFKRHPRECFFYKNFGRCKFGSFCSYNHKTKNEEKLMTEIEILKSEIKSVKHNFEILKLKVEDMTKKIENVHVESTSTEKSVNKDETTVDQRDENETPNEIDQVLEIESKTGKSETSRNKENTKTKEKEETLEEIMQEQTLEDLIRENSGLFCDMCSWGPAKTKKGLITHKRKKHSNIK